MIVTHTVTAEELFELRTVKPVTELTDASDPYIAPQPAFFAQMAATTSSTTPQPVPQPIFYLYDHLGNTRVTFSADVCVPNISTPVYKILQAADYFPYSKILREYYAPARERYLSTQHERDAESGFDYRWARLSDGEVLRFLSVDPLSAKFAAWSSYNYCLGNPVRLIDPSGGIVGFPTSSPEARNRFSAAMNTYLGVEGAVNVDNQTGYMNVSALNEGQLAKLNEEQRATYDQLVYYGGPAVTELNLNLATPGWSSGTFKAGDIFVDDYNFSVLSVSQIEKMGSFTGPAVVFFLIEQDIKYNDKVEEVTRTTIKELNNKVIETRSSRQKKHDEEAHPQAVAKFKEIYCFTHLSNIDRKSKSMKMSFIQNNKHFRELTGILDNNGNLNTVLEKKLSQDD